MRFKPGQKVVCVNDKGWNVIQGVGITNEAGPKRGDIATVHSYAMSSKDHLALVEWRFCTLSGLHQFFEERAFEPLMDISELTEILEQQPQEA